MNIVAKKLVGIASFMAMAGRLLLVKSVLVSFTIFFMGYIDVHVTIKHQVIKYPRHCLWTLVDKGPNVKHISAGLNLSRH